jgi:lysophospholipase L1-like esterase
MVGLGIGMGIGHSPRKGGGASVAPYPLDAFSGPAADVAWGSFVWTADAVGQTLVTDSAAATYAAGDTFAEGAFAGERIATLHDQIGGSDLVQATAGAQPTIWLNELTGWPEVRMQFRHGTAGNKFLDVSSPPAARSLDWTFVSIEASAPETSNLGANPLALDALCGSLGGGSIHGRSGAQTITSGAVTVSVNRYFTGGGSWSDTAVPDQPNVKHYVRVERWSAAGVSAWVDGKKIYTGGTVTATALAPAHVGKISGATIHSPECRFIGCAWFPALTDAQVEELTDLIHARLYGGTPDTLLYFDGDSITAGYDASQGGRDIRFKSWPALMIHDMDAAKRARVVGVNMAVTGAHLETTAETAHKLNSSFAANVAPHLSSGRGYSTRALVLSAGTNDIYYGAAAASDIITAITTYRNAALAAGATHAYVCTQIPRENFTSPQETMRTDLNALILSTFGANCIDVAAQNWQPSGAADWSTNYQDGIHPNAAGRALFVAAVGPILAGLI